MKIILEILFSQPSDRKIFFLILLSSCNYKCTNTLWKSLAFHEVVLWRSDMFFVFFYISSFNVKNCTYLRYLNTCWSQCSLQQSCNCFFTNGEGNIYMEYSAAKTINISSLGNKIILEKKKSKTQCCPISGIFLKD